MRISSNTKPMVAALALSLVEDGTLAVDDPVERFVPELAGRRVLRRLDAPLDGHRRRAALDQRRGSVRHAPRLRVCVRGRLPGAGRRRGGWAGDWPARSVGSVDPDGWVARFAELPLLEQPGAVWRYDLAYGLLGKSIGSCGRG